MTAIKKTIWVMRKNVLGSNPRSHHYLIRRCTNLIEPGIEPGDTLTREELQQLINQEVTVNTVLS